MLRDLLSEKCIWEKLRDERRHIFLYGTGNGADKILNVCESYDINVSGVFASSGFVRNRSFRNMPVRSIEDIRAEFGDDIIVLLAFGTTLDSVIENINEIARRHTLLIPEVPLYGNELFDRKYFEDNIDEILECESLFIDAESKEVYRDMIKFRYTGEPKYLWRVQTPVEMYSSILGNSSISKVLDCGAYKGDSAADIIEALAPREIICFEPDPKTFLKLSAYAEGENRCRVIPMNYAAGSSNEFVEFSSSGSRGSGAEGKNKRAKMELINIRTIDSLGTDDFDLIKLDVEGDEMAAIDGALNTISICRPALSISVYHRTSDIFKIPLRINACFTDYKFYMRRVPCIPAWDISLVAIPKEKAR